MFCFADGNWLSWSEGTLAPAAPWRAKGLSGVVGPNSGGKSDVNPQTYRNTNL